MSFCLPKDVSEKFKNALAEGKIDPVKMSDMTSVERRDFLREFVGTDAPSVNALFESKLLLKDQQRGLITWAKKVSGITKETRKDLITKIQRMEKALSAEDAASFYEDLAGQKLGADVSFEEAQKVVDLAKEAEDAKNAIPENSKPGSKEELAYGLKFVQLQNLVRSLKGDGEFHPIKDFKEAETALQKAKAVGNVAVEVAGTTRGLLSTGDNSFFGRQGLPVLMTNPTIWAKYFLKSWGHLVRGFKTTGVTEMDSVLARAYSSKNARLGRYAKGKLAIGIAAEEAFPSAILEKVPIIGNVYKGFETAFQAGAVEMRVALMDKFIARAEKWGVNVDNAKEIQGFGKLANALTGRGDLGDTSPGTLRVVNAFLFSPRFLKGNWDVLTAHSGGLEFDTSTAGGRLARRIALENVAKIAVTTAGLLFIADKLMPGSVEWDPRSSKFGKIGINDIYYDVTGGKGPVLTILSRANPIMPTRHGHTGGLYGNGWSYWSKSATTGAWTDLTGGKFGQQDGIDAWSQFFTGKFAPIPGVARDVLKGKNFQNEKPTLKSVIENLTEPLPYQSYKQTGAESVVGETFGLSATSYKKKQ